MNQSYGITGFLGRLSAVFGLSLSIQLAASTAAFAGPRDCGGGTGIISQGRLVVLDLAEAGAEAAPDFPDLAPDANILAALKSNLNAPESFKTAVLVPLAKKLTEIDRAAHPAGIYMATAFGAYQIQLTPYALTTLDDVDSPIGKKKDSAGREKGQSILYKSR